MKKVSPKKVKERDPVPDRFASIEEVVDFWDTHSLADYEDVWVEVTDVKIDFVRKHFRPEQKLAATSMRSAKKGIQKQ